MANFAKPIKVNHIFKVNLCRECLSESKSKLKTVRNVDKRANVSKMSDNDDIYMHYVGDTIRMIHLICKCVKTKRKV